MEFHKFTDFHDFGLKQCQPLMNSTTFQPWAKIMIFVRKVKICIKIIFYSFTTFYVKSWFPGKWAARRPRPLKRYKIPLVLQGSAHPGRAGPENWKFWESCGNFPAFWLGIQICKQKVGELRNFIIFDHRKPLVFLVKNWVPERAWGLGFIEGFQTCPQLMVGCRPGPARPGPARPGPARPGLARPNIT